MAARNTLRLRYRRLVDLLSGGIKTNRSTKVTVFGCADAHGVIVYNGIGMDDQGLTPNDWLLRLAEEGSIRRLACRRVGRGEDRLGGSPSKALREVRSGSDTAYLCMRRLAKGESVLYGLSNYERVDSREETNERSETVTLSVRPPTPEARLRIDIKRHRL